MGYNEADTRAKLINPKLHEAGWSEDLIRREITAGTVEIINGKTILQILSAFVKTICKAKLLANTFGVCKTIRKKGRMDYLLCLPVKEGENPLSIAVLEAKKEDEHATLGLEQAKEYAKRLNAPFVFSTNGHLFVEYDDFEENKYCKIFDNEVFGYTKVIVERPLQLNYQVTEERLENLYSVKAFTKLAESKKKDPELKLKEEEEGRKKQEETINALKAIGNHLYKNWDEFESRVKEALKRFDLSQNFIKNIILALSEHDDTADYVLDKKGNKLPDSNLRDSEKIPFLSACGHAQAEKQDVEAYFEKEIKPYYPVAWMDRKKDKVGYEINFTKYFYKYKPPRPIEEIEKDIKEVIGEIQEFLKEEL